MINKDQLLKFLGKEDKEDSMWDLRDEAEEKFKDQRLKFNSGPDYCGGVYLGRNWSDVGKDETGGQFMASIESEILKSFGKEIDCDTHEEAWEDR